MSLEALVGRPRVDVAVSGVGLDSSDRGEESFSFRALDCRLNIVNLC